MARPIKLVSPPRAVSGLFSARAPGFYRHLFRRGHFTLRDSSSAHAEPKLGQHSAYLCRQIRQRYAAPLRHSFAQPQAAGDAAWKPLDLTLPAENPAPAPVSTAAPVIPGFPPASIPPQIPSFTSGQIIPRKEDDPDYKGNRPSRPADPVPPALRKDMPGRRRLFSRVEEVHPTSSEPAQPLPSSAPEQTAPAQPVSNSPEMEAAPAKPAPEPPQPPSRPTPANPPATPAAPSLVQRSLELPEHQPARPVSRPASPPSESTGAQKAAPQTAWVPPARSPRQSPPVDPQLPSEPLRAAPAVQATHPLEVHQPEIKIPSEPPKSAGPARVELPIPEEPPAAPARPTAAALESPKPAEPTSSAVQPPADLLPKPAPAGGVVRRQMEARPATQSQNPRPVQPSPLAPQPIRRMFARPAQTPKPSAGQPFKTGALAAHSVSPMPPQRPPLPEASVDAPAAPATSGTHIEGPLTEETAPRPAITPGRPDLSPAPERPSLVQREPEDEPGAPFSTHRPPTPPSQPALRLPGAPSSRPDQPVHLPLSISSRPRWMPARLPRTPGRNLFGGWNRPARPFSTGAPQPPQPEASPDASTPPSLPPTPPVLGGSSTPTSSEPGSQRNSPRVPSVGAGHGFSFSRAVRPPKPPRLAQTLATARLHPVTSIPTGIPQAKPAPQNQIQPDQPDNPYRELSFSPARPHPEQPGQQGHPEQPGQPIQPPAPSSSLPAPLDNGSPENLQAEIYESYGPDIPEPSNPGTPEPHPEPEPGAFPRLEMPVVQSQRPPEKPAIPQSMPEATSSPAEFPAVAPQPPAQAETKPAENTQVSVPEAEHEDLDLDNLARQVYPIIVRKLQIEQERSSGRLR